MQRLFVLWLDTAECVGGRRCCCQSILVVVMNKCQSKLLLICHHHLLICYYGGCLIGIPVQNENARNYMKNKTPPVSVSRIYTVPLLDGFKLTVHPTPAPPLNHGTVSLAPALDPLWIGLDPSLQSHARHCPRRTTLGTHLHRPTQ